MGFRVTKTQFSDTPRMIEPPNLDNFWLLIHLQLLVAKANITLLIRKTSHVIPLKISSFGWLNSGLTTSFGAPFLHYPDIRLGFNPTFSLVVCQKKSSWSMGPCVTFSSVVQAYERHWSCGKSFSRPAKGSPEHAEVRFLHGCRHGYVEWINHLVIETIWVNYNDLTILPNPGNHS